MNESLQLCELQPIKSKILPLSAALTTFYSIIIDNVLITFKDIFLNHSLENETCRKAYQKIWHLISEFGDDITSKKNKNTLF